MTTAAGQSIDSIRLQLGARAAEHELIRLAREPKPDLAQMKCIADDLKTRAEAGGHSLDEVAPAVPRLLAMGHYFNMMDNISVWLAPGSTDPRAAFRGALAAIDTLPSPEKKWAYPSLNGATHEKNNR